MSSTPLNKKERGYLALSVGLAFLVVCFQIYSGLHTVVAFVSIAIVLLTILIPGTRYTYIYTVLATIDIIIGYYFSNLTIDPDKFYNLLYNRSSAVLSIWISAFLIVKFKQSRAEEEKSNQRMNALFTYATEGIIISDNNGNIVTVNPEAEKQFGYSINELIGKSISTLFPERFRQGHLDRKREINAHPETRLMIRAMAVFGLRKDATEFPVEVSISSFNTADGPLVVCFILDTTELILQRELTKALEREMELNELKSRFVAMASHEFRTPLSTIMSSVALVEKYDDPSQKEDKIRHINRIRSTVKNLTNILTDFLSLDKLESGLVRVNPAVFRLDKFCAEVVEEIRVVVKPGQQINYLYAATIRDVNMDQNLLRNILTNLLNNAIKYSPEKSYIDFSVSNTGDELIMSVKDSGVGIPEADKPFMFDRFFRAKNVSTIQGTGLGLNIVKRYVDLMKGRIDFVSEENKGTTFTVKLPLIAY
ncbi:MAG TPA: PAS domain-containing sensor histidine kinase [Bacteroidia bacterium]|jgi:two-component system sensor kinase FixL|nr:PAS domain-containing sensor histidine kinase [Bacteroidia bacterium]